MKMVKKDTFNKFRSDTLEGTSIDENILELGDESDGEPMDNIKIPD